jgi:hypothetical protein
MDTSNRNIVIGVGVVSAIVIIALYFYVSQPTTMVGSVPEPAASGQTK